MAMRSAELRDTVRHELIEYGINVLYLSAVFACFTIYRRLLLAEQGIAYGDYGVAVIEALVLGKVIMIGGIFNFVRLLDRRPLIYPVLYKTVVFCLFVIGVKWLEQGVVGWWHGEGIGAGLAAFAAKGWYELLANSLIVFAAFVPFFAVKELSRVLGHHRIATLFFRERDASSENA